GGRASRGGAPPETSPPPNAQRVGQRGGGAGSPPRGAWGGARETPGGAGAAPERFKARRWPKAVAPPAPGRSSRAGELLIGLLWTTVWITCVKRRYTCAHIGEMLGNPLLVRPGIRAFTWENMFHAPVNR